jgi:hypothetical protein
VDGAVGWDRGREDRMLKNLYVKNFLYALAVVFFGFNLLVLAFVLNWFTTAFLGLFFPPGYPAANPWFSQLALIIYLFIIAYISWLIFRSKLEEVFKGIYSTVPSAVAFAVTWLLLKPWPALAYCICAVILSAIIYYLCRTRKSWRYYYPVILVASVLLVMNILSIDIF